MVYCDDEERFSSCKYSIRYMTLQHRWKTMSVHLHHESNLIKDSGVEGDPIIHMVAIST